MKKLWVRWLGLLVFVALLAALFVRLGEWQLHRLDWRRANNARVQAYQKQPVRPYQEVFGANRTIGDNDQWQRVSLTGSYDAAHQLQAMLRNTTDSSNQPGSEVLTPMHTTRGDWVLVDRGFLVRQKGANELAVLPAPPAGTVTVTGYVRRSERGNDQAITPGSGAVRLINTAAISKTLPYPLVDGYVGLVESTPAQSGGMLPMATPELTEGPHLSYAIQWFCFTAIAAAGAGVLIRGDLRERRKARAKAERLAARAAAAAAEGGADEAADAVPAGASAAQSPDVAVPHKATHEGGSDGSGTH